MTTRSPAFAALKMQPADPLLSLIAKHHADPRREKIDLGVGVYRDATGATPVMRAVKSAEAALLRSQRSKSYIGPEGDIGFVERIEMLALGKKAPGETLGVQTPGGTGALRLAAAIAQAGNPDAQIWLGTPSWPIHAQIFEHAHLHVRTFASFDAQTGKLSVDAVLGAIDQARPGDLILLHACCHNPTGADFTAAEWSEIAARLDSRGVVPLIDFAYHGLGDGLAEDALACRMVFEAVPAAFLAYSCDKNFALYRERTGALYIRADGDLELVRTNVLAFARTFWSMPPDHGAAAARTILDDKQLTHEWSTELDEMRARLNQMRRALAMAAPQFGFVAQGRGLFALLPLTPEQIASMRDNHAVYMAGSGRINIAGLRGADDVDRFASALRSVG